MDAHRKGDLTEAVVVAELVRREIPVATPFGDNERYDLLVQTSRETFLRVQVKTGWTTGGVVNFRGYSQHTNSSGNTYKKYDGDVDCFLVYCHELERLFLVWEEEFDANMSLRVDSPRQEHRTINWADEFDFDTRWPPGTDQGRAPEPARSPAVPEVAGILTERSVPYVQKPNERYDFVAVAADGERYRLCCRTGTEVSGRLRFRADVSSSNVDAYCVHSPELEALYLVPDDAFECSISLRVEDPAQPDPSINWASDYEFDEQWPP